MVQSRLVLGRDRIVAEHSAILAAIVAGDVARAHELMESHLAGARDAMVASLGADSLVSGQ